MQASIDITFIVKFLLSIFIMNIGGSVISVGYRRLRGLAKVDSTNTIVEYFPERTGYSKIYNARWDSQKRLLFILMSHKWPNLGSNRSQMKSIRLLCILGLVIIMVGFVFGAITLFSLTN